MLRRTDAPALLQLWNRSAAHDRCGAGLLDEKIWQDPDYDPNKTCVATAGDRLLGFAVSVARPTDRAHRPNGYIKLMAVNPDAQRSGLGRRLLAQSERALLEAGVRVVRLAESAPNYLTPGVDLRYTAAISFFRKHGYTPMAQACNMRVRLGGQPQAGPEVFEQLTSAGIEIRRATLDDRAELNMLLEEFGGSWKAEVSRSLEHDPPLVHIARRESELLGFSASEGNNIGTGWFGPMGTTEAARGLGIGQVLLYRCLADLAAMGFHSAIIPWVGPVGFYARHVGAKIDRRFQRFEKDLQP